MGEKEFIVCAANHYDDGKEHPYQPINIQSGFITCGLRHGPCIGTFAQIVGFPYTEEGHKLHNTEIQGFITNLNRFVDRKEALIIATEANQLKEGERISGVGLHSENLY